MRIALIGYGKMGHIIRDIALQRGHQIVCAIDALAGQLNNTFAQQTGDGCTQQAGDTCTQQASDGCTQQASDRCTQQASDAFPVFTPEVGFQSKEFQSAQVAIEFSTPATAEQNIRQAWTKDIPVVCGTTGWDAASLMAEAKQIGQVLVWKSNFSVGVNLFFGMNQYLAEQMNSLPQYTPAVTETHHIHKLDKPSGTAKTIAEDIAEIRHTDWQSIPIESIREGEVAGIHTVTWDSPEDTIVITHIAKGRQGFALGAVMEAEKIAH